MVLTPVVATLIFVLTCLAGHNFRRVWKANGPLWRLWTSGLAAACGLLVLGFVPLALPS